MLSGSPTQQVNPPAQTGGHTEIHPEKHDANEQKEVNDHAIQFHHKLTSFIGSIFLGKIH